MTNKTQDAIEDAVDRYIKIMQHGYDHYHDEIHVQKTIKKLQAILDENQWQPIETAPKDEVNILVFNPKGEGYNGIGGEAEYMGGVCVARWEGSGFVGAAWYLPHCCDGVSYVKPTHWMPLPNPPAQMMEEVRDE